MNKVKITTISISTYHNYLDFLTNKKEFIYSYLVKIASKMLIKNYRNKR